MAAFISCFSAFVWTLVCPKGAVTGSQEKIFIPLFVVAEYLDSGSGSLVCLVNRLFYVQVSYCLLKG